MAEERARKRQRREEDLDNAADNGNGDDGNGGDGNVAEERARKRQRREGDEVDNADDDGDGDDGNGDDGNELMNEGGEKDVGKETDMEAKEHKRRQDSFAYELRSLMEAEHDVVSMDSIDSM